MGLGGGALRLLGGFFRFGGFLRWGCLRWFGSFFGFGGFFRLGGFFLSGLQLADRNAGLVGAVAAGF